MRGCAVAKSRRRARATSGRARAGLAALVLAAGASRASAQIQTLATGLDFLPETFSSGSSPRSHLVLRGSHLYFNDASDAPLKRMARAGGVPEPLVLAIDSPHTMAVRGDYAYAASDCEIVRSKLDGSGLAVLVRMPQPGGGTLRCSWLSALAVDDTHVYWAQQDPYSGAVALRKVPVEGGTPVTLATPARWIRWVPGLLSDGARLYWLENRFPDPDNVNSSVRSIPVAGGEETVHATGLYALQGGLELAGGTLYLADLMPEAYYRILALPLSGGPAAVLAQVTSAEVPSDLAVMGTSVLWSLAAGVGSGPKPGALRAVSITGGAPATLASGLDAVSSLAVLGENVYLAEGPMAAPPFAIRRVPLAGGEAVKVADPRDRPLALTAFSGGLAWVENPYGQVGPTAGGVYAMPEAGGAARLVIDAGTGPLPLLAADATHLYFTSGTTIKRLPVGPGGQPGVVVRGVVPDGLASDGAFVYWVSRDPLVSVVVRAPVAGGTSEVVASASSPPGECRLAIDATHVYWSDGGGTVRRVSKGGGTPVAIGQFYRVAEMASDGVRLFLVADGFVRSMPVAGGAVQTIGAGAPAQLAFDQDHVFWVVTTRLWAASKSGEVLGWIDGLQGSELVPNGLAANGLGGVYWSETQGGRIAAADPEPNPWVAVAAPGAGVALPAGSLQQVRWLGYASVGATVSYYFDDGATRVLLGTAPRTSRSFSWRVPGGATTGRVEVESVLGGVSEARDVSDSFSITPTVPAPPPAGDFDLDGQADLLWHHQGTGELYVWMLDGTVAASGGYLTPRAFADTRWQIRGLADLDGDGDSDILWHHQTSGDLYVWFLQGRVVTSGSYLKPRSFSDTLWQIRGLADFDGDGDADLLWHHQGRGDLYVWLMQGLAATGGGYLTPKTFADTRWQIRGVADFTRDGQPDILWHHQVDGGLYLWAMEGLAVDWGSYLTPAAFADTRWQIRRIADFDGDGQLDLLWHHQQSGELYAWLLDGTVVKGGSYFTPRAFTDTRWQIMPR